MGRQPEPIANTEQEICLESSKHLSSSVEYLQVKARKEAARKDEVLDNITDEQLQAIEQEFIKATADEEEAVPAAAAPGTD